MIGEKELIPGIIVTEKAKNRLSKLVDDNSKPENRFRLFINGYG
jgi:hypothetical protein